MNALLTLTPAELATTLASLSTEQLIGIASPRSVKPVKSRTAALRVIADEVALYATYALLGTH